MHDMRYIPDMGDVMKIGTEQLEALQRQEQTQKKTTGGVSATGSVGDFGALLSQELAGTEASQSAASVVPPGAAGIDPLLMASTVDGVNGVDATSADATGLDEAMAQLDGLLDNWDAYARELGQGASSGGLRGAYSMLQGIDSSLRDLKQTMPNLSDHEGLAAVVNELEVMAATEKFKFNRGDYAS
ncbi:hypothetical protein RVX_R11590 [Nitratidesulfovibrio sp. HK-II]|uniref:hypothetical protein n=1 Tax=Nitratidesulfovibrio sp. HK-II TaxID=2009266 RepID=UPI000E2E7A51|nr:hypothetical protein [Nitratidesulfovibrio sp. HK-II]GBO95456.1 hypothetical protein RVX_0497 [Nitratidesulfovibrio sp. HK-II]